MKDYITIKNNSTAKTSRPWHMGQMELRFSLAAGLFFLAQAIILSMVGGALAIFGDISMIPKAAYQFNFGVASAMSLVSSLAMGGPGFLFFLKPLDKNQ